MKFEDLEIGALYEVDNSKRRPDVQYSDKEYRYFVFLGILSDPDCTYSRSANIKLYFIEENEQFFVNYRSHYVVHAKKCQ